MSSFRRFLYSSIALLFVLSLTSTAVVYADQGDDGFGGGFHDSGPSGGPSGGGSSPQSGVHSSNQEPSQGGEHSQAIAPALVFPEAPLPPQTPKGDQTRFQNDQINPQQPNIRTDNEIENELEKDQIKAVTLKANDGGIEFESETATGSSTPFNLNKGKNQQLTFRIREGSGSESSDLKVRVDGNKIDFEARGNQASTNFPLSIDANGQLVVNTPNGPRVIRVLPDKAAAIATESGILKKLDTLELEENPASSSAEPVFTAVGSTPSTLLGFIPVTVPTQVEVGAQSGRVLSTNQPFWVRLFSPFIKPT